MKCSECQFSNKYVLTKRGVGFSWRTGIYASAHYECKHPKIGFVSKDFEGKTSPKYCPLKKVEK